MIDWRPRARALADVLTDGGELRSDAWRQAFAGVPRHVFVPSFTNDAGEIVDSSQTDHWLDEVYADTVLITQTRPAPDSPDVPTSSSTMPSIMAVMLEALDVRDGHRVLEIGTGTGYNAALLCHRLGAPNVASVDIDPELVNLARARLAGIGYTPTVAAGDGAAGLPGTTPYDRIISTAAVSYIPPAWIEQLAPGGKIVTNLRGDISGGLIALAKDEDEIVAGRFSAYPASFMPLRADIRNPNAPGYSAAPRVLDMRNAHEGTTFVDPHVVATYDGFRFFLQLHLAGTRFGGFTAFEGDVELFASNPHGAWVRVAMAPNHEGVHHVSQGGIRAWDTVEAAYKLWQRLDAPAIERFGVSAGADRDLQHIWLDHPNGHYCWPLPL